MNLPDSTIAIIGGADGPTEIFITGGAGTGGILPAAALAAAAAYLLIRRAKSKK